MTPEALRDLVVETLDESKGRDIVTLPVADLTDITDYMIIVSGTSNRHVKSLVDHVVEAAKAASHPPRGEEIAGFYPPSYVVYRDPSRVGFSP